MHELTLSRVIPAPIEDVWHAWTTAAGLATWWWNTWDDTRYSVDPVVGGDYRFEAAEHGFGVRGTYGAVEPLQLLAFSWIWYELSDGRPVDEAADQVQVRFSDEGDATRLELWHAGPWTSADTGEGYRHGWTFVLDALEAAAH